LDGFPLALATAGAYLNQVSIGFADYLRLYKKSWAKLQKMSPGLGSYEDRTLYSTWQISFDYVEQRNPLSAKLLRLWAYFDNQDLWFELLRHADCKDPEWIRQLTEDELNFHDAVRVLSNHGLVEVAMSSQGWIESKGYSIHGCIHSWAIHALNQEWDSDLGRLAVKFVGAHVPGEEDVRPWLTQRRLLQHAARCSYFFANGLVADNGMEWACNNLGILYQNQGKLAEAEAMYQRALRGEEKAWGLEHTSTLDTVSNLGVLYKDQGRLAEAEAMYQRALRGREKAWGLEHTSTLDTVNNLGNLYKDQGKLVKAEAMYERALRGKEKAWGLQHTSTLNTVNNLGNLYTDQGKLVKAEAMYERALRGREKAWGLEHTSTLDTVNNLGVLYKYQGKLVKAEAMYERALRGKEKAWGLEHTSTLDTVNNLGILYKDQGKLVKAEAMYQRALRGKEKALGLEHTSTLGTVNNLGVLYKDQGRLAEAEAMYERALRGYERVLGANNAAIYIPALNTIWGLGSLLEDKDDYANARIMYSKALVGFEKVVGPDHPSSRSLRDRLCVLDERIDNKALTGVEEPMNNLQTGSSHLGAEGTSQESKRNKLLKKNQI
jgi:tetratricopeptide (TPR) repeat protein